MSDELMVTLAGIGLIIFVLWYFFGAPGRTQGHDHSH